MEFSKFVKPLARQSLSGDVYAQLSDLLMSGRVMPGEPISLRTIAAGLGVSVMPVRDAINRLLSEKALELMPNRTFRVPTLTVNQFQEITTIRVNLEGLATERAALLADSDALLEIENAHQRFLKEISSKRPDPTKLVALNKALHFVIYKQAQMPMLLEMIESLWLRIGPIVNYDFRSDSARLTKHASAEHHDRIIVALKKKDAIGASKALTGDIQGAAAFIISAGVLLAEDASKGNSSIPTSGEPSRRAARK